MRRGIVLATTVKLSLIVVAAVFLFGITAVILLTAQSSLSTQCALSSSLRHLTGKLSLENIFALSCPRQYLDVGKDTIALSYFEWGKVKKAGGLVYPYTQPGKDGQQQLYSKKALDPKNFTTDFSRLASYEMYRCWQDFGSGTYDVTGSKTYFDANACVICTEIYLDPTSGAPTTMINLLQDLNTSHVPFVDSSGKIGGQTYSQALYDPANPSNPMQCLQKSGIDMQMSALPIAPRQDYAVVFYRNGGYLQSVAGFPAKLAGSGGPSYCQAVATVPIEQAFNDCDALLN